MTNQRSMPDLSVDRRLLGNLLCARLGMEELGLQLDEVLARFDTGIRQQHHADRFELAIAPAIHHTACLRYIPVMVTDACGAGNDEAGQRAVAGLEFMGDAFFASVVEICLILHKKPGI
jgi:hypothetical protein